MVEKWIDCVLHAKVLSCVKCCWVRKMKTCGHGWYWQVWLWWSGKTKSLFRANSAKNGTRGIGDQVHKHFFLGVFCKEKKTSSMELEKSEIKRRWFFFKIEWKQYVCLPLGKIHLGGRNRWCMKSRENSWGISLSVRECKSLRNSASLLNWKMVYPIFTWWAILCRKWGWINRDDLVSLAD